MDRSEYGGWPELTTEATGYFRVERLTDRYWLVDPEGKAFLSLGANHLDSSTLRYPDSSDVWESRYDGDQRTWIEEGVRADLLEWGFNTVGWAADMVTQDMHHSRNWTTREYQWADMPYCLLVPFAAPPTSVCGYSWDRGDHFLPGDVFRDEFAEWCDYVAREWCAQAAEDPNLIGYFFGDVPVWTDGESWPDGHVWDAVTGNEAWADVTDEEAVEIAERYYDVVEESVRRYDENHLLLGDRFDGNRGIPGYALDAAADVVDVLSVQYFATAEEMLPDLRRWHEQTNKPILIADAAYVDEDDRGAVYARNAGRVLQEPYVVGWHWCSYLANHARSHGLKNKRDESETDTVRAIRDFHDGIYADVHSE